MKTRLPFQTNVRIRSNEIARRFILKVAIRLSDCQASRTCLKTEKTPTGILNTITGSLAPGFKRQPIWLWLLRGILPSSLTATCLYAARRAKVQSARSLMRSHERRGSYVSSKWNSQLSIRQEESIPGLWYRGLRYRPSTQGDPLVCLIQRRKITRKMLAVTPPDKGRRTRDWRVERTAIGRTIDPKDILTSGHNDGDGRPREFYISQSVNNTLRKRSICGVQYFPAGGMAFSLNIMWWKKIVSKGLRPRRRRRRRLMKTRNGEHCGTH